MTLKIEAPGLEEQIREVAEQDGLTAEQYAMRVLDQDVRTRIATSATNNFVIQPTISQDTPEWTAAFNAWVDSHRRRAALPEHAFDRASFYEGRP